MTEFHYRAVTAEGDTVSGSLEEASEAAAVATLQGRGLLPVEIGARRSGGLIDLLNMEITPRDALGARDRIAMMRSLATLTGAGVALDKALELTRDSAVSRRVRACTDRLLGRVREGERFSDALDREGAAFSPFHRGVIRAGEAGATLDTTLARLADALEEEARRAADLQNALIYPAFLVVTAIGSVAVLLIFVVPTFEPLLTDAGVEPPVTTRLVIGAGRVFEAHWPLMLGGLALLAGAGVLIRRFGATRRIWDRALLGLPVFGTLLHAYETARITRLLGMLLESGVALPEALRLAEGAARNAVYRAELSRLVGAVETGRGLAVPLVEGAVFPPLAGQLIRIGQEGGQLADLLGKTGTIFDDTAARGFDRLLGILTPVLTLVMGGLVAVIVSSILFALFSINELAI